MASGKDRETQRGMEWLAPGSLGRWRRLGCRRGRETAWGSIPQAGCILPRSHERACVLRFPASNPAPNRPCIRTIHRISLAWMETPCLATGVTKEKTAGPDKPSDRKTETRRIGEFVERLIEEGKAKTFLVQHGFVTPSGRLTKRYGG